MLMALSFGVYITFAGDGNVSEVTAASGGITVSYCKSKKKEGEGKLKSSRCLSEERFDRNPPGKRCVFIGSEERARVWTRKLSFVE